MLGLAKRLYTTYYPPNEPKVERPLRFGILGAAVIAPIALINPARSHPEVVIAAVAARDLAKAEAFAKKHSIKTVYGGPGGYQQLINDPDIDVIYIPLPNGLHYEWSMKALEAGKHVLLEKPSVNRAEEMKKLSEMAQKKSVVLLEGFHAYFHPAIQRVKQIIDSDELGSLRGITANLELPRGIVGDDDIRTDFNLGGGVMMDMGVYPLILSRYLVGTEPSVVSATAEPHPRDSRIDRRMTAKLSFPFSIYVDIVTDLAKPPMAGLIPRLPFCSLTAKCELGNIQLYNFGAPSLYHYIHITKNLSVKSNVRARTETAFTFQKSLELPGEDWWTTYRYMLEAFVNVIKGRQPQTWVTHQNSINQMEAVERIYEKAGLPLRPLSTYVPQSQ